MDNEQTLTAAANAIRFAAMGCIGALVMLHLLATMTAAGSILKGYVPWINDTRLVIRIIIAILFSAFVAFTVAFLTMHD